MEMSDEELARLEKYILEGLPKLLQKKPEIKVTIYQILAEEFPTRTELTELIEELRNQRIQFDKNFKKQNSILKHHGEDLGTIKTELEHHKDILVRLDKGIGTIGRKIGSDLEKLTRKIYLETLKKQSIDIKQVKRRQKIEYDGEQFEIDIYSENDILIVFETKYTASLEDASIFLHKMNLLRKANPSKQVQGFLIAVTTVENLDEYCKQNNIYLITNE